MNKTEKETKRDKLTSEFDGRVAQLLGEITNLTIEFNSEVKRRQDEIDALSLQSEALTKLKIT